MLHRPYWLKPALVTKGQAGSRLSHSVAFDRKFVGVRGEGSHEFDKYYLFIAVLPRFRTHPRLFFSGAGVEVADVGCGFGGLLLGLAPALPGSLCLGMEIRTRVAEYVRLRILALRKSNPGAYENISVLTTNSMKHMLNFFHGGA